MKQNPTVREKSLKPEPVKRATRNKQGESESETSKVLDERIAVAISAAGDKKAQELVVLDLRGIASFTDYFLIASGTNSRQVQAIADEIVARLKKQGTRAQRVEGYRTAEWVLVDYGDFIAQIFDSKSRQFYDLERLWRDAERVTIPDGLISEENGRLRSEES